MTRFTLWTVGTAMLLSAPIAQAQSPVAAALKQIVVGTWSAKVHLVTRGPDGAEHLFKSFDEAQFSVASVTVDTTNGFVRLASPTKQELYIIPFDAIEFVVSDTNGPTKDWRLDLHLKP